MKSKNQSILNVFLLQELLLSYRPMIKSQIQHGKENIYSYLASTQTEWFQNVQFPVTSNVTLKRAKRLSAARVD